MRGSRYLIARYKVSSVVSVRVSVKRDGSPKWEIQESVMERLFTRRGQDQGKPTMGVETSWVWQY